MMINSMKRSLWSAALAGAIGFMAAQANAATITSVLFPLGTINEFQDSDAERVLRDGAVVTSGNLEVGDVLQAVLRFTDVNASLISDLAGFGAPYQLKAYSEIRIAALLDPNDNTLACTTLQCDIVFEANTVDGLGTMFSIYESNTEAQRLSLADSAATSILRSQDGTLVFSGGLVTANDFWVVNDSIISLDAVKLLTAGDTQAPNGNFGLSEIGSGLIDVNSDSLSATNLVYGTTSNYDLRGTSSIYGRTPGVSTDWLVSTNSNVQFIQVVPEPGSLALVGLALVGMGAITRRRKA